MLKKLSLFILTICTIVGAVKAQEHPRLFRDSAEHPTGASWIAAQRAKATIDPLPAMLAANENALLYPNYPARPSTLAALYLYEWPGVDNTKNAEHWAQRARLKTLALLSDTGRWANTNMRSLSRGIDNMHVGVAYDILSTSQDWQTHIVQASDLGIKYIGDTPFPINMPAQYVGLTMNEAVSLALKLNSDSLIAAGGSGWPGNDKVGNNWFAVRFGGAMFGYLASDVPHDAAKWNDAMNKLSSHLDATLTRSPLAQGWNPEGHNYMWFPNWHTLPLVLALQNINGQDLTQTWPALKLTAWAATWATSPMPIERVKHPSQVKSFGIHPDMTDDNNRWNPEGNAGLSFAFAPESYIPGIKWMYRRMTGDLGDQNWDAESGGGIYSMLFWPDVQEENPALSWGKIYYDPLFGMLSFRNGYGSGPDTQVGDNNDFYAMDQDIAFTMSANMRSPAGGHGGPDSLNLRLIGLGDIWATGQGRNNDVSNSSTLFPDDPESISRGANRFGTKVVDTYLRQPTGDGYVIMSADINDAGATDHVRRVLIDYSGKAGVPAVFVVSDSTTSRNPWWRMATFFGHTIDVSTPGRFVITSPDGDRLLGVAMVSGDAPQMRTGVRRRATALDFNGTGYIDNKWVDFQAGFDGEVTVAMMLVPAGDPLPSANFVLEPDGTTLLTLTNPGHPGNSYALKGNQIEVNGWNPPSLEVLTPAVGSSLAQTLSQHQNIAVTGTTGDVEGGIVETVDVYLNGNYIETLTINSASANWGPVVLPTLDVGSHSLVVVATDNDNEEKTVEVPFRVTATQPPIVALTSPSAAHPVYAGQNLVIKGHAFDPENRLARVEVWEYRHIDRFAGTGPTWRKLGNATMNADGTWSYTFSQIPSGHFEFYALAFDQDNDSTQTPVVEVLSSLVIGDDPVYGDLANFRKNFGPGTATSRWAVEWIDGSLAMRTKDGDFREKQAYMKDTGSSASFQLRFRVKAEDMANITDESYEVALGDLVFVDMTTINSVQASSGGTLPNRGTRVYEASSQHNTGMISTFNWYRNNTPGYPNNPPTDFAGIPNYDWNDVTVTRLGSRLIVEVNDHTIIDGVHPRVRTQGAIGIGFKRDKAGRFYFKDVELDWLDANGDPIIDSKAVVTWSTPANHSNLPVGAAIALSGTVSDADGIRKVELLAGSAVLGEPALNGNQWSFTWDNPIIGQYSLALRVTDEQDRVSWSDPLFLEVNNTGGTGGNLPPTITIGENGAVTAPNFGLTGSVVDPEGRMAVVQIYTGGKIIGIATITGTTWNYTVSNLPTGTYEFTALAIDDRGASESAQFIASVDGNAPPSISSIANQSVLENSQTDPIAFSIGDDSTAVADLIVTAVSNNPTLLPEGSVILGGSAANRTIQLIPATNETGTAVITVTVTDAGGKSTSILFGLYVGDPQAPNQAPEADLQATPIAGSVPLTVDFDASGSTDPDGDTLSYSWSFGDGTTAVGGALRSHTYQTVGTYTAVVTVSDGIASSSAEVVIGVDDGSIAKTIVLDTEDGAGVIVTGAWTASTGGVGYNKAGYIHDGASGKGTKSVQFFPNITVPGNYRVYFLYTQNNNRASNVPVDVIHRDGVNRTVVNQKVAGGVWFLLGTYPFDAGATGSVLISTTGTSGYVIADAVKFELDVSAEYEAWLNTNWVEDPFAFEADALFDADADGVVNLLEYALGGDPNTPDAAVLPQLGRTSSGESMYLTLRFHRMRAEVTYLVEASDNMSDWSVIASNPGTVGEEVIVEDTQPVGADQPRMLRLRVEM